MTSSPLVLQSGNCNVDGVQQNQTIISTSKESLSALHSLTIKTELDTAGISKHPPDGGLTAWLVVFAGFLFSFNGLGIIYSFGVYQAHYLLYQFPDQPAELISFIGAICTGMIVAFGVPMGRWIDLYGHRTVALGGSIIFSGALLGAGFCRTVPQLIVTQGILTGLGAGALFIPANVVPTQWFLKRRALAIGIAASGAGVGGIAWAFISRAIIARLGYQWSLRISACISGVLNGVALLLLKTRVSHKNAVQASMWSGLAIFKNTQFVTLYLASAVSVFGYMVPYFYVPTYAETQLGSSPLVGSILAAVIDVGLTIGRIVMGITADSKLGTVNTVVGAMALAGLCQFAFWLPATNSLPLLYIFSFIYGFLAGGYIGLLPAVLARIFDPEKLPTITGIFITSELIGEVAGGPIAGAIYTAAHGNWTPVIVYSSITMIIGSIFAMTTRFQGEYST